MTERYVSVASGNDTTGSGTSGSPWATLGKAAASISGGDRVHVAPGTYTLTEAVNIGADGTDDTHRTTFVSDVKWGAQIVNSITITNSNLDDPAICINADFVDVVGFDISGSGRMGIYAFGNYASGHGSPVGSYMRVTDCYIHDLGNAETTYNVYGVQFGQFNPAPGYCAMYNEAARNVLCNIGATGQTGSHGIYFGTGHGTITNNICSNIPGFGIRLFHFVHHMTVANNLVFACGSDAPGGGDGLYAGGGIYLSAGGTGWRQGTDEPADYCLVANNIVRGCIGYGGLYEYGNSQGANTYQVIANNTFTHNCYYGNAGTQGNPFKSDSGAPNAAAVLANPLFVDYQADGTGDYHLTASSPCKNAGTASGAPAADLDGYARPEGALYDIGPYEYHGARVRAINARL